MDPFEQVILNTATANGAQNPHVVQTYDLGKGRTLYPIEADWPQNDPMRPGRIRLYVAGSNANLNRIWREYPFAAPIQPGDLDAIANTIQAQIDAQGFV